MESLLLFLNKLPPPIWALAGVFVGGIVTLYIEAIKSARRRRAISEVVFMRLYALMSVINNLFVGGNHTFPFYLKKESENRPFIIYSYLFSQSTLPAYRLVRGLAESLFSQETHITGISWIISKLEVAEATRQYCVSTIEDHDKFLIAWYQYCLSLREYAMGCTQYLLMLYDLSSTPFRRLLRIKKRKKIRKELEFLEAAINKSFGDFYNILSTDLVKQRKRN